MAKWFKFEEKRPKLYKDLILWHPIAGALVGRLGNIGCLDIYYKWFDSVAGEIDFKSQIKLWQYAPKGPKEE